MSLELSGPVTEIALDEILPPAAAPRVMKLRESHQNVARLVATGLRPCEVSAQTGYSLSRLSILKNDPAFIDLVAFYAKDRERLAKDVEAQFLLVGLDYLQELHERLLDDPESIKTGLLHEIVKSLMDRAGFSPISRSINKNFTANIGVRMDRANGRQTREEAA